MQALAALAIRIQLICASIQTGAVVRISERGQITIPKHLRDRFGMNHNVEVEITPTEQGLLIRKRPALEHPVDRVYGILRRNALGEGVTVDDYIEEIRER